jgi:S1/P1 Nuclease
MSRIACKEPWTFLLVILLTIFVRPTFGWNHTGHMINAELAWRNLSASKRKAISNLLKQHPHYALLLATNVPPGVDTNEWAFLNAAVWPDMVRPGRDKSVEITKYHRSPWHYINIPYVAPSAADHISATSFSIPPTNILSALSNSLATLAERRALPVERAVSLCWVMHLVGDLHQPLHAATFLSDTFPQGDQGGNLIAIADASQVPLNLHSFWDQLFGTGDTYECVACIADQIADARQYNPRKLGEYKGHRTIDSWAHESFEAACAFAYDEGHLKFAEWRAFSSGKVTAAEVPRLKSTYLINANEIARRRVALAGQRLADVLRMSL